MRDGVVLGVELGVLDIVATVRPLGIVDAVVPSSVDGLPAIGVFTFPANDERAGDPLRLEGGVVERRR